ncbi:MAG: proteobacterial dedicated sortase system response regulator [Thiohalomonadales bacterium]
MTKLIAIVEDEPAIRENYAEALRRQGYQVSTFANRPSAIRSFREQLPDLALLDIGLEDEIDGGFELCRELRSMSETIPIIFLSARDSDLDTISGLRLGADDYLTKDISIPNLCARITAFFRRIKHAETSTLGDKLLERGDLILDLNRFVASWNSQKIDLTLTEFWIVHALVLRPGHVKSREQLMQLAKIVVDDATITSHIKRIRNKIIQLDKSFDHIETVYGLGYRWLEN